MIELYTGTGVIEAEPFENDGTPGYKINYPGGYTGWLPKLTFDRIYRKFHQTEKELLNLKS